MKVFEILPIFSFALAIASLFIVATNLGVQGYEISIYDEYPMYLWYLIIFSIFTFQLLLFLNFLYGTKSSLSWKSACIGIILMNFALLIMPFIRGYSIYGLGDPVSHRGYMLDISQTGHISSYNMYPIDHILGIVTHQICGFDLNISMLFYPSVFYIIFVSSFYLLFRLFSNNSPIFIGMILSTLLFAGNASIIFAPNSQANSFLPFIFYLYLCCIKFKKGIAFNTLIIISLIFITFFHPLTAIFLIISFSIYEFIKFVLGYFEKIHFQTERTSKYLILIMFIIYFSWQTYAVLILGTIKKVYTRLYGESLGPSTVDNYFKLMTNVNPDPIYMVSSFIYVYGLSLLLIIMGLFSLIILLNGWKNKKYPMDLFSTMFSLVFLLFSTIYIISFFLIKEIGFNRSYYYAVFSSIFLVPLASGYSYRKQKMLINSHKIIVLLSIIVIFFLTYLSVFTLYSSPITKSPGQHLADSWLIGINSFFEKRDENLPINIGLISIERLKDGLYGRSKKLTNIETGEAPIIPEHFGYINNTHFAEYYGKSGYFIMPSLFKIYYEKIFPEFPDSWKFNQTDFFMLENDNRAHKIYSNRELDIYFLFSNRGSMLH